MLKHKFILCFLILFSFKSFATHIVGGEIYYDCLGGNNYKITLKLYRDCYTGLASYDNPATIFLFNAAGTFVDSVEIPFPGAVTLPVTLNNPCFTPPTNVCVEEAIYETIVNLPPSTGGYNIVYQRCCRNNTILNLISAGSVGSTYMAHIPDPGIAACNNSPRYNNFPPIFLCEGLPLDFDHSATDADGDSLHYELCDPYEGLSSSCMILGAEGAAMGCPAIADPPPYAFVPWQAPYNAAYPMSASPIISVDPVTGYMTGTPNMVGQWVVGVCVSEYRGGVLISVNKRDFQFNVVVCPNIPVASIPNQTLYCFGYLADFDQASLNAFTWSWDFGDPTTTSDVSTLSSPSWTYPDSGVYTVTLIINQGTMCADTSTNTFYIYPLLEPAFTLPAGECLYTNSFNFNGGGDYMGNGTFSWDFGTHATPSTVTGLDAPNIVYDTSGIFPVSFTIVENGCTETYTQNIEVYAHPQAEYGLQSPLACALQPVHFLDSSYTTAPPLTYYWTFGDGGNSVLQNPWHVYPAIGNYSSQLIVADVHGCLDTAYLDASLVVNPTPTASFIVSPNDTSIFYPDVYMTNTTSSPDIIDCDMFWGDGTWYYDNCDSMHTFTLPGTYTVMQIVENIYGCIDTAYLDVLIRPEYLFWIPNAFTPGNNDGMNDVFKPSLLGVHEYSFMIFDRWGEVIFKTSDPNEGWDGCLRGRLCTNDVFVYKINFRDDVKLDHHQFIGHVTLVR